MRTRLLSPRPVRGLPGLLLAAASTTAAAQAAPQQVVITGSVVQRAAEEAPYAITVVDRSDLRDGGPMINLSESLVRVPGLVVNNRSNYAQDLQISSRGYGARATFGVRGMRLYADGIPATGPDGQGQVSHFDIAGAERVEVLRGPFSVLYGNSSGGVIAIFGAPATRAEVEAGVDVGSFGLRQLRLSAAAPFGEGFDIRAGVAKATLDGFRPHSAAEKRLANARLGWRGAQDTVTVRVNDIDQPADDPLGLERAQFDLGPDQTAQQALDFDTRKTTRQTQLGASWTHRFGDGLLRETQLAAYSGRRSVTQWLAIPALVQRNPAQNPPTWQRHGGGVIDFDRDYGGVDGRLRFGWESVDLVVGAAVERQRDERRGFENFTGVDPDQLLGVTGALRREETNRADTRDLFAQAEWAVGPQLALTAGVRRGRVKLSADDAYLSNGDDSGALEFDYTNPVLGLRWQAAPGLQLHASVARGFESPTLGELAYRIDGTGGFNSGLDAQTSRQFEIGAKWRAGALSADLALFEARTDDEIGVATNSGGRSAYQNVGRTLRRGLELGAGWRPPGPWRAQLALSVLDATYRDDFLVCAGVPCAAPSVTVPAGNRIAGTQRASAWSEWVWSGGSWGDWALELRAVGSVPVNDRNSDFAAGYGLAALRWTKSYALGASGARMEWLLRADNLFDRHYAGSVIVNDGNGRFFEPGAPRAFLVGLRVVGAL